MKQRINNKQALKLTTALRTILVGLIVLCSCSAISIPANATLSVPITVQEALPSGVSGMARIAAPVTVGLPLPENSGITNISQLGLSGVTAGQFRPLAWWPNGNIQWVLTDFQTDLTAGQTKSNITLTDGTGNFGGSNLASDGDMTITVDTGIAQFVIRKANFNIFDSVVVNGQTLISSGNAGRVSAVGTDDILYTSANDATSTASIEENGPLRAVIKTVGTLKSAGSARLIDYTIRLYFYKNKSFVKSNVTFRNADKNYKTAVLFKSMEATVPITAGPSKVVTFSRASDVVTRTLAAGDSAKLFQGYNKSRSINTIENNCNTWNPPVPGTCTSGAYLYDTSFSGLEIVIGAETVNALGNNRQWAKGYADLSDTSGKGLTVVSKFMESYWPSGFELIGNGAVSIEIYAKRNTKTLTIPWGKHDSHEIMWDFHLSTNDGNASLFELQYPLLARTALAHYKTTKSLFGQAAFVTPDEQYAFFAGVGKTSSSLANPAFDTIVRSWAWPATSGTNQTDLALDDLIDYLRTGNAGFYLRGEQWTQKNSDGAVFRSDNFTLEQISGALGQVVYSDYGLGMRFFDMEHAHASSIPLYYFLTGNEEIKDSFVDYGEHLMRTQIAGWHKIPTAGYFRAWSRKLRNLSFAYEFSCKTGSCNTTYKNELDSAISTFLDYRDIPGNKNVVGRNLDRGYVYWDVTTGAAGQQVIHSFFHTQIHFEAVWQLLRIMEQTNWNYSRQQDLEDYLTGLSHFFFDEYIRPFPDGFTGGKYGFDYEYYLQDNTLNPIGEISRYSAERPAVWLYERTGDQKYLNMAAELVWEITQYANARSPAELQEQAFLWTYLNKTSISIWKDVPLTVTDNGGGSYTLSWTVPTGTTKYQIKYSDKPIVEWLGFDKVNRTYQYAPTQYTAFFAAKNIANNPTPAKTKEQSITLTGLPTGQQFSMKCLVWKPNLRSIK